MALVMLPYGREFLEVPAMGFIVMLGLGYVEQLSRQEN